MSGLTQAQIELRKGTLGASEIASVAGLSPWQSVHDTWLIKRGLAEHLGNVTTRMGTRVEACVREEYCADQGAVVEDSGTVIHPEHSWMSATPDGIVVSPKRRLLEIKCVTWRLVHHWGSDPDAIPAYYRAQIAWQMECTDIDEAHLAAWIGGADFRIYTVQRDRDLGRMLIDIGKRFWFDNVLAGEAPAVDGSDGARRMLEKLYPRNRTPLKQATPEVEELASFLRAARAATKAAEEAEATLENKMVAAIADAEGFASRGWRATNRADKNGKRRFLFKDLNDAA